MFDDEDDDFNFSEEEFLNKAAQDVENQVLLPTKEAQNACYSESASPEGKRPHLSSSPQSSYSPILGMSNAKLQKQLDRPETIGSSKMKDMQSIYLFDKDCISRKEKNTAVCKEFSKNENDLPKNEGSTLKKKKFQFKSPEANECSRLSKLLSFEHALVKTSSDFPKLLDHETEGVPVEAQLNQNSMPNVHEQQVQTFNPKLIVGEVASYQLDTHLFSQDTCDSDLDLTLDDLSPWKPGKKIPNQSSKNISSIVNQIVQTNDGTVTAKIPDVINSSKMGEDNQLCMLSNVSEETFRKVDARGNLMNNSGPVNEGFRNLPPTLRSMSFDSRSQRPSADQNDSFKNSNIPFSSTNTLNRIQTVNMQEMRAPNICASVINNSEIHDLQMRPACSKANSPAVMLETPVPGHNNLNDGLLLSKHQGVAASMNITTQSGGTKRKRKFPGPAGVLPKLKKGLDSVQSLKPASQAATQMRDELPASQRCEEERFNEDSAWSIMLRELDPQAKNILHEYSIQQILSKAVKKQLPRGKVQMMCVLLDQVHPHLNADASITVKDRSGEMQGTVHRQLLKEYPALLISGAVLVLRQVAVFSPSPRSHYLNITPNNIVRIYARDSEGKLDLLKLSTFITDDFKLPDPSEFVSTNIPSHPSPTPRNPQTQNLFANRYGNTPQGQFQSPQNRYQSPIAHSPGVGNTVRPFRSPYTSQKGEVAGIHENRLRFPMNVPRFNSNNTQLNAGCSGMTRPVVIGDVPRTFGNFQQSTSSPVHSHNTRAREPPPWLRKNTDQAGSTCSATGKDEVFMGQSTKETSDKKELCAVANTTVTTSHCLMPAQKEKFALKRPSLSTLQSPTAGKTVIGGPDVKSCGGSETSTPVGQTEMKDNSCVPDIGDLLAGIEDGLLDDF